MSAAPLDPDLLAAFAPEFDALAERLAAAADLAAAAHALEMARAMAEGFGIGSLAAMLAAATTLLDPTNLPGLRAAGAAIRVQAAAIVAAGHDLPVAAEVPGTGAAVDVAEAGGAAPAPTAAPAPPAAAPVAPAGAGIRTLLVDDSPTMRRIIRDILAADPDFTPVGEAADGAEALAMMQLLTPDLILLDIEMPVLDGLGVLRGWALRGPGAVVVVSSAARPGSAVALEARRLGAAGIVAKPSGALSLDLMERGGTALLETARRAAGLPARAAAVGDAAAVPQGTAPEGAAPKEAAPKRATPHGAAPQGSATAGAGG